MKNLVSTNTLIAEKVFKMEGKIVANPDFAQYFRPRKLVLVGTTLADLKARQRQFIDESALGISSEFSIGGGNWGYKNTVTDPEGKIIGRMSYNGRIWNENDEEVLV
jgi:hypothetical protein